jgi:pyocin large subunit-like protein
MKTKGFVSSVQLGRHFAQHGAGFGAGNIAEYERLADTFLGDTKPPYVQECFRSRGDCVRFDPSTNEYGVVDSSGIIRTYFKPVPCSSLPASIRNAIRMAGRCHGQASNLLYFQSECARW